MAREAPRARAMFRLTCSSVAMKNLFAVSPDRAGTNIPRSSCTQGWLLRQEFKLGRQGPVPAAIGPEPILRSTTKGYYIWRAGRIPA
jgi:hypothetical protein